MSAPLMDSSRISQHIEWVHSGCLPKCHSDLCLWSFLFFRYKDTCFSSPLGLPKDVTCDFSLIFFSPLLISHLPVSLDLNDPESCILAFALEGKL